jgi:hypothetical protein
MEAKYLRIMSVPHRMKLEQVAATELFLCSPGGSDISGQSISCAALSKRFEPDSHEGTQRDWYPQSHHHLSADWHDAHAFAFAPRLMPR